ncbi:MAG: hypothetical protein ABFR82_09940 [Nitrospirota bacterium]
MSLMKRYLLIFLILMFFTAGCQSTNVAPEFHVSEDVDLSFIKKVAVMPFDNLTSEKFAGDIIRHVVVTELLATGLVDVAIPGEVINSMKRLKIKSISALTAADIKKIGKSIKVQAIILGSVEQYGEIRAGNISVPEVTISLMMADAASGSIVWSVTKTRGGATFLAKHFGASSETLSETVLKIVRESLQTLVDY